MQHSAKTACSCVCADGDGEHIVDSITWAATNAIAASSLWYDEGNEEEQEGPDAYLLGVTWDSWTGVAAAEPQGVKVELTSYVVMAVGCQLLSDSMHLLCIRQYVY